MSRSKDVRYWLVQCDHKHRVVETFRKESLEDANRLARRKLAAGALRVSVDPRRAAS